MDFFLFSKKAKSLAYAIYKFQCNINNKKAFCIDLVLQDLVNYVAALKLKNFPCFDIPKRKMKAVKFASSCFYNAFWLTYADKFLEAVVCFEKISANS